MAFIIDDILMLPVQGFMGIFEAIKTQVDEELSDEAKPQQALLEAQTLLDMGEITEDEYQKRETKIMERLEAIRKYKEGEEE
ncbi:MAG: gas vesicle protein GvpG [Candidatus Margulisiibacteriota bacterium]